MEKKNIILIFLYIVYNFPWNQRETLIVSLTINNRDNIFPLVSFSHLV